MELSEEGFAGVDHVNYNPYPKNNIVYVGGKRSHPLSRLELKSIFLNCSGRFVSEHFWESMENNFNNIKCFHVEQVVLMSPDPNPNKKIR